MLVSGIEMRGRYIQTRKAKGRDEDADEEERRKGWMDGWMNGRQESCLGLGIFQKEALLFSQIAQV